MKKEVIKRIIKFQIVAWGGTIVNLIVLWLLKGRLDLSVVVAGAFAIELAIIHNFSWHYFITWRDRVGKTILDYFIRLVKYNFATASIDFTVNLGILWALTKYAGMNYLIADIIGMIAGPIFKFIVNEFLIFKKDGENEKGGKEG